MYGFLIPFQGIDVDKEPSITKSHLTSTYLKVIAETYKRLYSLVSANINLFLSSYTAMCKSKEHK